MFDSHSDGVRAHLVVIKPEEGGNTNSIKKFHINTSVSIWDTFTKAILVYIMGYIDAVDVAKELYKVDNLWVRDVWGDIKKYHKFGCSVASSNGDSVIFYCVGIK